ncbi:MAG TPA: ABATE domain-containing protein [Gemmatimonadaceae bacterium]|jgi:predicted RNA-binding Zn ribbon-like protein|nr:ABATE domain-containing protein [Gemmatimonadaceae bacterium]
MAHQPGRDRYAPDAPFKFVGGDPSVDFVNTANWTPRGLERDRLTSYDRLLEWSRGAGVLDAAASRRAAQAAVRHPRRAAAAVESAHRARQAVQSVFASVVAGKPNVSALDDLNLLVADVAPHVRVVRDAGGRFQRGWDALGESPESVLWPVIWATTELLSSADAERLRMCAGNDCGWLYVDRSRNGLRRWCEMSVCGMAEKNRRRASR